MFSKTNISGNEACTILYSPSTRASDSIGKLIGWRGNSMLILHELRSREFPSQANQFSLNRKALTWDKKYEKMKTKNPLTFQFEWTLFWRAWALSCWCQLYFWNDCLLVCYTILEKIICSYIIVDQSVHMILLNHLGNDVRSIANLMNDVIEQKDKRISCDWKGPWGFLFSFSNRFQYLVLSPCPNDTIKTYQDPAFSWSQAWWGKVGWGGMGKWIFLIWF